MNDNIHTKLSIADIAKHCCISDTSLKNIFLEFSQLGVHQYFFKMKINRAATLLKQGKTSQQIAYELGFLSQEYFSTAFKREMGLTPREYKKLR